MKLPSSFDILLVAIAIGTGTAYIPCAPISVQVLNQWHHGSLDHNGGRCTISSKGSWFMLALNRPKYAPLFMRTDGRVGRVNASQVSEDMLQLQNPMKVSVERPNTGSKQRVNNYESRDPRSSRSGGADGARSFRSSRDEGSSSSSRTMNRDSRSQQPRSFDRRDRDERGPPRSSFRTGSSEPALILNNPKKMQKIQTISTSRQQGGDGNAKSFLSRREGSSMPPKFKAPSFDGPADDISDSNGESNKLSSRVGRVGVVGVSTPRVTDDRGPRRAGSPSSIKKKSSYSQERDDEKRKGPRDSLKVKNTSGRRNSIDSFLRGRGSLKKRDKNRDKRMKEEKALERRTIRLPEGSMTVGQLSEILDEKPAAVIKFLMTDLGVMAAISQTLDHLTCVTVAQGFNRVVAGEGEEDEEEDDSYDEDDEETALESGFALDEDYPEDLVPRPPVVTIMGHVDHGKTSLLDAIRNTRVQAGEAGGITQHIGAYQVEHEGNLITFIDTPGHAAFTDMRSRGANMTDIVILVVAADDGVKQQTVDSIACARTAGVPIVVAINKCDLDTASPERVKTDLTSYGILTEDLGGDVLVSEISAKQGTGLSDLLSKVMLQSEIQELTANPNRAAQGALVEAKVEKGLGTVATTLIQKGTIKVGDAFVAGETYGRVRALIASDGKTRLQEAGPSTPVSIIGFADGVPAAGDLLVVVESEQMARELAESRVRIAREKQSTTYQSGLMDSVSSIFSGAPRKEQRNLCVVIKADVVGSAEALARSLSELSLENEEVVVKIKVILAEAGDVTKTDVAIASVTPGTTIIAFNTAATMAAMDDARTMGVQIEYHNIVYDAIESIESRMQEVLSPTPEGEYVGSALVQEVFNIGGTGNIAGSRCLDGIVRKGSNVRIMRGDKILAESKVKSLRNFKAEVDSINAGDECGIGLTDFEDFQAGDIIESYVLQKQK